MIDPDLEARLILRSAGLEEGEAHAAEAVAAALEISTKVYPSRVLRGDDAVLFWPRGRAAPPEIALRRGMTPERAAWCVAHELAEHRLGVMGYVGEDREQLADAIAAALLMPRESYQRAATELGDCPIALAGEYATEQTAAALRLAEVGRVEAAMVVSSTRVYARSSGTFEADEEHVRRLASGRATMPGVRSVRLTDARRVAVLAA